MALMDMINGEPFELGDPRGNQKHIQGNFNDHTTNYHVKVN